MAGKKIEIDIQEVERLAGLGLDHEEIALNLGISLATFKRRKADDELFELAVKRGKARTKRTVTSKLMEKIEAGDLGAIIWYEKTRLGFTDKQTIEHTGKNGGAIEFNQVVALTAEQELDEWRKQQLVNISNTPSV